ncbi:Ankyrin repeat domain-containing protein 50 [Phytophthora cinnamomi]|uniref:Ankyrin repeat domain-containing protein 50 n=1 Tax=Phytophthora cinnamomi TaxID=4785 RepID=UPI00355A82DE|nr:Ankyrin repeat domain-containing protein 50 [Phytophthora cinnamomi]
MAGGDVAYVQLPGATLGLYAGMAPQELQQLVRAALRHRGGECAGFQVSPEAAEPAKGARSGRKKRASGALQRLVPLSLACQAPELLTGRVAPLFAPAAAPARAVEPQDDAKRLQRLLDALLSELQLSAFEAAVLRDLCEQQSARVLREMQGQASVESKRAFLLRLLRPEGAARPEKQLETPEKRDKKEQGEDALHAELAAKRVAAIGRRVFSPQVQTQVLALADETRANWRAGSESAAGSRFADTMELLAMVERLLDKHVLPEEHGAHLLELVLGENRVLWSALQSYKNDGGSLTDLETTAKRLAALGCDPPKPIASKARKGKSPRRLGKHNSPAKKRVRDAAKTTPSAVAVVRSLNAQHMLTSLELDIVQALVAQEDSQVLQILSKFEQSDHRDVGVLRDALVGIVEEITMELGDEEKAAAAFARGLDDAVREESSFVDSDDDSESLGWQRHVGFLLGQWQAQHHLTPADANTLRRMVAQRHNLLESAYEVFAGDGDASELLDTLQRVAKLQRQIEQSQAGQNVQSGVPVSDLSLEDIVREMQRRGVLQAGDAAGLLVLFHGGNEALQAANEAFMADGDVHELEETLLLVVKHARFAGDTEEGKPADESQVVSRLLAEFGRSGRLELWQIQLLMSLCKSHDARLFAAVDVYHDDQNVDELIDTLEILVELAAWERHRRAMVHDWIAPLARSGKLPRGGAERLVQLVKARDDRVVAALVVFLSDNNKEEFVDTLARIACLEAMKLKNVQADAAQDESKEGHLVLVMLKELEEKGVVSEEERKKIEDLVCGGEPRMLAAMDVLAATHDTEDFVDTARRILAKSKDDADAEKSDSVEAQEPTAAPSSIIRASPAVTTGEEEGVPTAIEVAQDAKSVSQNPENNAGDDSAVVEKEVGEKTDEMAPEERSQIAEQKGRPPELAESEEAGEENDEAAAAKEEATEEETKVVDKVDVSEEEQEEDMGKAENEPAEEQEEEQK